MRKAVIFAVLAFLLAFCVSPAYANGGLPALPHAFYGSVTIDGAAAPNGTQVSATVENGTIIPTQNPVTTAGGSYGTTSLKLLVQGDIPPGATIRFYINGVDTGQTATFEAGGGPTLRDLSVTIPPAGGGFGGGGGGGAPPPSGTTDVRGLITTGCRFTDSAPATSEDGLCTLTIPGGTVGLTSELECLAEISMLIMDEPPPPPEAGNVIGLTYDFQPSGATFDPPITLTFSYDPADIPEGIAEEDLVLAYYDEAAGEWVELEGCVVDPVSNTITASVSHFSAFVVVFIPSPAAFIITGLEVSPAEADIGGMITIRALVENTGGMKGINKVTLKINGEVEQTKYVVLGSGASARASFIISRDVAGSYSVEINGLTGSFTVKAPPELAPAPAPPAPAPPVPPAKPINWPVLGAIIAGVVIVGLSILFLARRRAY